VWNVWLVFTTFLLVIFGTFLTRSGVVSSVHAFAQSSIGTWFVGFLIVIISACLIAFLKNRDYLRSDNQLDSMISRESSFLFNKPDLLVACVAVLSGTLFRCSLKRFAERRSALARRFSTAVNIPIAMFLLFLTGVGPLLAWRKTSMESLRRNFGWPLLAGVVAAIVAVAFRSAGILRHAVPDAFGVRDVHGFFGVLPRRACHLRPARVPIFFLPPPQLAMRNTRRYGGYVIHFGMVLVFIGISGQAFNQDKQMDMSPGSVMGIGPYTLHLQNFDSDPAGQLFPPSGPRLTWTRAGKSVMMLYPQRRFYPSNEESARWWRSPRR